MFEPVRVAIDVGGTFTDVVTLKPSTGEMRFEKVPTTPDAPTRGVLNGFAVAEASLQDVTMFNHGTTLGVNCLITRTGARTAIVSTRGFRDVYLLARTDRKPMYDLRYRKPKALVERSDTFEVTERSYFDGSIARPLDVVDARAVATEIARRGYESVAVAFLHSYVNPEHELQMREILLEVAGDIEVTLSHELSREYREYERTSTAVLDAYIKPIVRGYLHDLEGQLAENDFTGRFLMSRSGGGAMTASTAREQPVNLILSGPAGGVVGAAAFSRLIDLPNLITIDMGGTSLDASLIVDGAPLLYQGAEFDGLPINTPSLNIQTIGAGGGSLAWLDAAGALQMGPQSAGAAPGPAAYGRGGTEPTFTDAALVLGYLGTDTPLGGTLTLDTQLAENALRPVADTLGMTLPQLARGMLRISNAKIMGAVRGITIELGLDPKDFALLSFGGGGGLVAVDVARELGVPTVVVPPGSGAFSALGMLMADVQHDFARTAVMALADADLAAVASDFEKMEAEAALLLAEEGFGSDERRLERTIDVRYSGQEHSVTVECPSGLGDGFDEVVSERFAQAHERQYGHTMTDPIEITTLRVHGVGVVDKPSLPKIEARIGELPIAASRTVYMGKDAGEEYALYVREELRGGDVVHGPAVITEHTATTVMHSGDTLTVGSHGELIISIAAEQETTEQEIAEQEIAMTPTDPITIEVVRHGLIAAAEEMARNLCRTAYNTVVYEIHDYGLGIHDVNGDVVADVPGVAEFTRGNDYGVKKAIEFVGIDAMGEGDVFIVNYPYWSSAHTLDPLVLAPAHHDGKLIGFVTCRVHVLDLKQKDAGYVLDSTDMYQEGIFFPVVRLYQGGKQCDDIFNIVRFNSRMPERTIGDIQAQVSACFTGQRRMREIAAKYGNDTLHEAMAVINAHGEKLARLALTKLPKGTWTASDFVDSDGVDLDTMVKLNVTVTVTDDEFVVDWTGSATGVRGPINVPVGDTQALCCLIFKSITTPDSPVVAGNFAPLRVVTEPGSVMHAIPPMPTFTMWTGILAGEVVLKALAQGMPDIVPACSGGDICSMMGLGVNPRNGEAWLEATNEAVGFGAHAAGDGEDGIMHITEPGCRNNPVEVLESKSAMVIDYYGYRPDTGGAGEYRGGVGVSRVYRFTAPSTAICIVYKTKSPPWAMAGGSEGVPNQIVVNPGTENEVRKGGSYNLLEAGEVLANNTGGGGGYGDPLRRAPAKVARDAQNGFVSVIAAEREYGVVVDAVTLAVDETATTDLRAGRMRA